MGTPKVKILGALYQESVDGIHASLANKVDKGAGNGVAYVNDENGNVTMKPFSQDPSEDALASYSSSKTLKTEAPESDLDCVNKGYVDPIKKKIDELEGTLIKYTEDSSESYSKKVPIDAAQKAVLNRVCGKTIVKSSKNICTDAVEGGIPFEIGASHGIMFTYEFNLSPGTYSFSTWFDYTSNKDPVNFGGLGCAIFSQMGDLLYYGYSGTVTITEPAYFRHEVELSGGENDPDTAVSGKMFVNIVEGTEIPTEYEPYEAPSLEPTKVTEVISKSANKIPFPYINGDVVKGNGYKKTNINGLTWSVDAIGRIKVNGTATANSYLTFLNGPRLPDGDYELSGCPFGGGENRYCIRVTQNNKVISRDDGNGSLMAIQGDHQISAHIYISKGTTVTNLVFYPQLRRIIRYPIPDEIQNTDGYGEGIGQYFSYIDLNEKKYIETEMLDVTLNGKERWYWTGRDCEYASGYAELGLDGKLNENSDDCTIIITNGEYEVYFDTDRILVRDYSLKDLMTSDRRARLVENLSNSPILLHFATGVFKEHDLSDILANYTLLEVDGGGELIAENKNKSPVPWTVTFAEV